MLFLNRKLYSMKIILILLIGCLLAAGSFYLLKPTSASGKDWPEYLGGPENSHYSNLNQITKENIKNLKVAWTYNSDDLGETQCNPIVTNGMLYGMTAASEIFALDPANGEQIWRFAPFEKKKYLKNRGVTYWEDGDDKRILFSYDSLLIALNANTGVPVATFGTDGKVNLKAGLGANAQNKYLMSRTPGSIFEDLIIMPTVMMEDAGAAPGFIQAFHVKTGELAWIFHTIPLKGQFGADTWPADVHTKGVVGGANSWAGMAIDNKRGIVFAPTGSAAPDFFGESRKGQNLFANSLLALDARTGKRIWHYQIVRHDIWDMDLPAPPNLLTINKDGKKMDVVAQLTKKGHLFVFDRETGEPVFPIDEYATPASPIPTEAAWPYQPIPRIPLPISRQEIFEDDINPHSPDFDSLLTVFRSYRKGIYMPVGEDPTMVTPGLMGGAEWGGGAIDPNGIMYVNSNEVPWILSLKTTAEGEQNFSGGEKVYRQYCSSCHGMDRIGNKASGFPSLIGIKDRVNHQDLSTIISSGRGMMPGFPQITTSEKKVLIEFLQEKTSHENDVKLVENSSQPQKDSWEFKGYTKFLDSEGRPGIKPPWGRLTAIDLNTGQHKWQVPLGEIESYKKRGIPNSGTENYGGPIVTATGILFIGATEDNKIRAFDTANGALLWESALPYSAFATPSTYQVNGEQYIVIACGGTKLGTQKGDAFVAFKLDQKTR